jgi:serine beta-lactamase-like protein LACTB, mitochondrial
MRKAVQALAITAIMILRAADAVPMEPGDARRSVASVEASPAERNARRFLERLRSSTRTPAVSGAVARGGEVIFSAGSGLIDVKDRTPATGGSVYNIGSVSKAITAIAVMQLVEQRRVGLDDDVRKYVPAFPDKGATITIRHLLTHTSGIRHYRPDDFPGTPDNENVRPLTWEQGIRLFSKDPLLFPPGKYFFYTSYGVNLLQGVVQKASGMPFEQYVRERVFRPAGAATASFDVPNADLPNRARSYRIVGGKPVAYYYNDLRYKLASGGMIASAEDLVRLGAALNHGLLTRPETRQLMLSSQLRGQQEFRERSAPKKMSWRQGMLWRLRTDPQGRLVAYECGSVKGSNACVVDFLEEDLVAAVATNSWECCGWKKADALAAFFRSASAR